jgi:hypothetical protein
VRGAGEQAPRGDLFGTWWWRNASHGAGDVAPDFRKVSRAAYFKFVNTAGFVANDFRLGLRSSVAIPQNIAK